MKLNQKKKKNKTDGQSCTIVAKIDSKIEWKGRKGGGEKWVKSDHYDSREKLE